MGPWTSQRRIRFGGAVALVLVGALVSACGEDDGMVTAGETAIVVTVTADGSALSGTAVDLFAEGSSTVLESATTDADGEARFTGLDAGTYEVEITVPSGFTVANSGPTRRTVTVSAGGESSVSFTLEMEAVTATDTVEVAAVNFEFTPADLTIAPNTLVRWVNQSSTLHTVTPDGHNEWTDATLSNNGSTFEHVFTTEGTYPYYCTPHRGAGMTGTVTVQAP